MTFGLKSVIAVLLAVAALAIGVWRGVFSAEHFVHLSAQAAFAIGLFASACTALVMFGWRPRSRSRTSIALRGAVPAIVDDAPGSRELPALAQRALVVVVFATIALGTLGNEATARIASVPADLTKPTRSQYCPPDGEAEEEPDEPEEPAVEPQQVDQAGCALVKRAYALGYAKSLGSCAPKTITIAPQAKAKKVREVCDRRQLDEPFLHFTYRKVVDTMSGAAPVDAIGKRVDGIRTRIEYAQDLLADIKHAITGTPHASHHLWTDLADPHPSSWTRLFAGEVPCTSRFADLALWPAWDASTPPGRIFEHAFGQLLFATRFGTPAGCSDFTIHWGATPDTCAKLAADPAGFLGDSGAAGNLRSVLDRRRRQLAMRAMMAALGEPATTPPPPPSQAVASATCLMFDGAKPLATKTITVDGETVLMRELHAQPIASAGSARLGVYQAIALALSGTRYAGASASTHVDGTIAEDTEPGAPVPPPRAPQAPPSASELPLLALEPLVDDDPFLGGAAAFDRADLEVYPIEQHLHAFIDAFRRVYLPQRGRL